MTRKIQNAVFVLLFRGFPTYAKNMVECKCFRNLVGFAVSRPPCAIFTVCLATFAVGLFSLGYYVQTHGIVSESSSKAEVGQLVD